MGISSKSGRRGESEAETSEPVCLWLCTARGKGGMIMSIVARADQRQISPARQVARRELVRSVQECKFSFPSSCVCKAAGEDAESLSGIGLGQYLNTGNPLDPFK